MFRQQGLTLIELLVVMALAAITAVIALPEMAHWAATRRVAAQAERLANLIRFARHEAVRLNLPVYICPVQIRKDGNPDQYCDTRYLNQGIAAFADTDRNRAYTRKTDLPLRTVIFNSNGSDNLTSRITVTDFSGNAYAQDPVWLFQPDGRFGHAPDVSAPFAFSDGLVKIILTDSRADTQQQRRQRAAIVLIDHSGRVSTCRPDDNLRCSYTE
ncbi:GspH/FimT family pseudopilin [Neisseria lisongii]|uniref:Type II secretion system protein H n=1 Tax=Neisseria lisongii TaxID=2912188 RepID=A0AAW5AB06_9NEIS|nr:GspH/FimT family pseudopilin [Neisseria lisongii]MCF7528811.1 GspH/FimT family pseudopilin [Neisseria lisongii]